MIWLAFDYGFGLVGSIPVVGSVFVLLLISACSICACKILKCNKRIGVCSYRPCFLPIRCFRCQLPSPQFTCGDLFTMSIIFNVHILWSAFRFSKGFCLMEISTLRGWSRCFGRLALLDTICAFFPSHRIGIVRLIFGRNFEKSLQYHKIFGFLSLFFTILHFIIVLVEAIKFRSSQFFFGSLYSKFPPHNNTCGLVAAACLFLLVAFSMRIIRVRLYHVFYLVHIILSIIFAMSLLFHGTEMMMILIVIGVFFSFFDIIYRRLVLVFSFSKITSVYAYKPLGMVRINMRVPLFPGYHTGQFVDIYIPRFNFLVPHPFTITSSWKKDNEIEIYIKARGRFSKKIFKKALKKPKKLKKMIVRISGPFGNSIFSPSTYNKGKIFGSFSRIYKSIFLVADGVCASGICFGLLREIYANRKDGSVPKVTFFWLIREMEYMEGFNRELRQLCMMDGIDVGEVLKIHFVGKKKRTMYSFKKSQEYRDLEYYLDDEEEEEEEEEEIGLEGEGGMVQQSSYERYMSVRRKFMGRGGGRRNEEMKEIRIAEKHLIKSSDRSEGEGGRKGTTTEEGEAGEAGEERGDAELRYVKKKEEENVVEKSAESYLLRKKEFKEMMDKKKEENDTTIEEEEEEEEEGGTGLIDNSSEDGMKKSSVERLKFLGSLNDDGEVEVKKLKVGVDRGIRRILSNTPLSPTSEGVSTFGNSSIQQTAPRFLIREGPPNLRKAFKKAKGLQVGVACYGSKNLLFEVKRVAFQTRCKNFHFFSPLYQM